MSKEDSDEVTKEAFYKFINEFPRPLVTNSFMEIFSYNDFEGKKVWPESVVAYIREPYYPTDLPRYYIKEPRRP